MVGRAVGAIAAGVFLALMLGWFVWNGSYIVGADRITIPVFSLVDQDGTAVTEANLVGRPTLLFFGYTHCPDICPTTLFQLSEVLIRLGADAGKVNVFFITVDPERDTPTTMQRYLSAFDPRLRGLTGNLPAVEALMASYQIYAHKIPYGDGYSMDHTTDVLLLDKDGSYVSTFDLSRSSVEAAADLRSRL